MTLIKLTEYEADTAGTPIWVDPDRVSHLRRYYRGGVHLTEIRLDGASVFVLETAETVLGLVGCS